MADPVAVLEIGNLIPVEESLNRARASARILSDVRQQDRIKPDN